MARREWTPIVLRAREIALASAYKLTLRGLHYRLVEDPLARDLGYRNVQNDYKALSSKTAEARRDGWFPDLEDLTRSMLLANAFDGVKDGLATLVDLYRRDRTEGQSHCIVIAVEKRAMGGPLEQAFGEPFGIPVIPLAGYVSQTLADDTRDMVAKDGRPAVCLYAGDFDPSGEDIERDWRTRTGCFDTLIRVALTEDIVADRSLPESIGKDADARADAFAAKYGRLVQVELEALDPADLIEMYRDEFTAYWDDDAYARSQAQEEDERNRLREISDGE